MFKLLTFLVISVCVCLASPKKSSLVADVNSENFNSLVETSNKFWIIKYYIPWCGFCIKFAPTFEALAKLAQGWNFIKFGQVSCPHNSALCASHGSSKAPDVKLIVPSDGYLDIKPLMTSSRLNDIRNTLLDHLDSLHSSLEDGKERLPYLRQIQNLKEIEDDYKIFYKFVIVENLDEMNSRIAELVILDMFKYRNKLRVYRMSMMDAMENMNVATPGLYQIMPDGSFIEMNDEFERTQLKNAMLSSMGIEVTNGNDYPEPEEKHPVSTNDTYVYSKAHGLHMADLITNLRYSLWKEVSMLKEIGANASLALKNYLRVLIHYHPADLNIIKYLELLLNWLEKNPAPITSQDWLKTLASLESTDAYIPSNTTWKGCNGSQEHFRGYPCSLWMTFHTLSVRAYIDYRHNQSGSENSGIEILLAIRGFIENFFGCSECTQNFLKHTTDWLNRTSNNWSIKQAVLDLWRKHNLVNQRLHREPLSEDPKHPKIQFPAFEDCKDCRKTGVVPVNVFKSNPSSWNVENVFMFLLEYYGPAPMVASCAEKGKTSFSSKWTPCSRGCGTGISMRLTNNNKDCILKTETRICFDRPCSIKLPDWIKSPWHRARCSRAGHTYQMNLPVKLQFHNCTTTVKKGRKICGLCPPNLASRRPVCCKPSISRTEFVEFKCSNSVDNTPEVEEDGAWLNKRSANEVVVESTMMPVEVIELCECSEKNCE